LWPLSTIGWHSGQSWSQYWSYVYDGCLSIISTARLPYNPISSCDGSVWITIFGYLLHNVIGCRVACFIIVPFLSSAFLPALHDWFSHVNCDFSMNSRYLQCFLWLSLMKMVSIQRISVRHHPLDKAICC
jgi:hypothetical protein